jgi:hypothetical protein
MKVRERSNISKHEGSGNESTQIESNITYPYLTDRLGITQRQLIDVRHTTVVDVIWLIGINL